MNVFKNMMVLIAISPVMAFAQSDITPEMRAVDGREMSKPHVGLRLGVGEPEGELNSGIQYALEYGLQVHVPFSLALEAGYSDYAEAGFNFNRTSLLLKGNYNFGGTIPIIKYSYVGIGLGAAWEKDSISDGLAMLIVPQAGFDIPVKGFLNDNITLGLNTSYTFTTRSTPEVFAVSGIAKYWF